MKLSTNKPLSDVFKELDPTFDLDELRTVFGFSSATKTAIPESKVISLFGDDALIRFLTNLSADRAECPLVSTWVLERWDSLLVLADQITPRKLIQFNSIEIKDKKFSVGRPYTSIGVSSWPAKFDDQANVKYGWRLIRLWLLAMRYEHYPKDPADDHVEGLAKQIFKLLRGQPVEQPRSSSNECFIQEPSPSLVSSQIAAILVVDMTIQLRQLAIKSLQLRLRACEPTRAEFDLRTKSGRSQKG